MDWQTAGGCCVSGQGREKPCDAAPPHYSPEQVLWYFVIERAFKDALWGDEEDKDAARRFLFRRAYEADLRAICRAIELDVEELRQMVRVADKRGLINPETKCANKGRRK